MKATITPYLMFGGRCQEALEFYRDALGAKIEMMMRFSESPEPPPPGMLPAGYEQKVMHACLTIGGATVYASDGCSEATQFAGISLSLAVPTEADAHRAFDALAREGKVQMPLTKTFFSPCFGTVDDRFGVTWMVIVADETTAD